MLGKLAASVADQGVASSTNFLLNVFLARWLLPREYGAYSVCWSILLVLAGFHNALILEPMTVVGPAGYIGRIKDYLKGVARLNWLVTVALSGVALCAAVAYKDSTVRISLMVLAACVPGYLLLLVERRRQYVLNQPEYAFRLSLCYALLVFALIYIARITNRLTVFTALASVGIAGVVGLVSNRRRSGQTVPLSEISRGHWRYGKWLVASSVLTMGAPDVQTILLSMLVDLRSAGALRALMNFVLPLFQLMNILSIYALPRLSERAQLWGPRKLLAKGLFFPAALTGIITLYLGTLTLFAPQLEHLLYGGKMQGYVQWVPLLAASAFIVAVGGSFSTLLRAVQNSQHQFIAGVAGSAVGLACGFYLLKRMGIAGALWSMLAANLASTTIIIAFYLSLLRRRHA